MAQIDSFLKRVRAEFRYSFLEDIYDLYGFVPNPDLQAILAGFHTELNKWLTTLNSDLRYKYDEDGGRIQMEGYFHADDSRQYLALIEQIDQLRSQLKSTPFSFDICNEDYATAIKHARKFVVKSGGSTIPSDFASVNIEDLSPVFQFVDGIVVAKNQESINVALKKIGSGSYATVSSYIDPQYGIHIAVKKANSNLDKKELLRFKQEFEVLKSLHSPYVVEVYSYNDSKNEYTMEFMDETISSYIGKFVGPRSGELSLAQRKRIIYQVCNGLKYIHSKNLLHRDISLTNVFVKHYDDVDVVKIGDFGLVKMPNSDLTSLASEIKGSLNDSDLIHVGFGNYEMCHEIFALTRLCTFILIGQASINSLDSGSLKQFWEKGTNPDRTKRFTNVDELLESIRAINDADLHK